MGSSCRVWLHVGYRISEETFHDSSTEWEGEIFKYRLLSGLEDFASLDDFVDSYLAPWAECSIRVTDEYVFISPKLDVGEDDGQHYTTLGGGVADFYSVSALGPELIRIEGFFKALGLDVGKPIVAVGTCVS
jgi:hypothetical protein